jgi:hypothetical protein
MSPGQGQVRPGLHQQLVELSIPGHRDDPGRAASRLQELQDLDACAIGEGVIEQDGLEAECTGMLQHVPRFPDGAHLDDVGSAQMLVDDSTTEVDPILDVQDSWRRADHGATLAVSRVLSRVDAVRHSYP